MNNIDWKRKLTSRKFWLAVVTAVVGFIMAFGGSAETAETVSGCIMSVAAVIAYIIGEGLTDKASVQNSVETQQTTIKEQSESVENEDIKGEITE